MTCRNRYLPEVVIISPGASSQIPCRKFVWIWLENRADVLKLEKAASIYACFTIKRIQRDSPETFCIAERLSKCVDAAVTTSCKVRGRVSTNATSKEERMLYDEGGKAAGMVIASDSRGALP